MFDFERRLGELTRQTVLCVGDVMLDRYVYGDVARVSPEAPTVVLAAKWEDVVPGGAGNVALNIAGLGARCILVGVSGNDEAARTLRDKLAASSLPLTPTRIQRAPRPAMLSATLPAPPGTTSSHFAASTTVGASGETRATSP